MAGNDKTGRSLCHVPRRRRFGVVRQHHQHKLFRNNLTGPVRLSPASRHQRLRLQRESRKSRSGSLIFYLSH
jgi:hypothetical protein